MKEYGRCPNPDCRSAKPDTRIYQCPECKSVYCDQCSTGTLFGSSKKCPRCSREAHFPEEIMIGVIPHS